MTVSNMKYKRLERKLYNVLDSWWMLFPFAITGLIIRDVIGAVIGVGVGYAISCLVEILWPFEASELQWNDIKLAVRNYAGYYRPGIGKIKFKSMGKKAFFFEKRKIVHFTEDKRFIVWYRTKEWAGLLDEKDEEFFTELCGKAPVRDAELEKSKTFLIPQQEDAEEVIEACLAVIRHLVSKSGGTVADVKAVDLISGSSIWTDVHDQEVSPVPIGCFNFKGKKDGRPVLYIVNRKGYWILQEDGKLEPFTVFDAWYNTPSKKQSRL